MELRSIFRASIRNNFVKTTEISMMQQKYTRRISQSLGARCVESYALAEPIESLLKKSSEHRISRRKPEKTRNVSFHSVPLCLTSFIIAVMSEFNARHLG